MPAVNTKAEETEKVQKKEERKDQDEQAKLLREERLQMDQMDQMEAMLRKFGMSGYRMDFQSWTLTPDPNYFSDLLAKQQSWPKTGKAN